MSHSDMKLSRMDKKILRFAAQAGGTNMDRFTIEQISTDTGCTWTLFTKGYRIRTSVAFFSIRYALHWLWKPLQSFKGL